jgi:hypothetical protein
MRGSMFLSTFLDNGVSSMNALDLELFSDGEGFSSHCRFITGDVGTVDQNTVGWDFHTIVYLHDVSCENFGLMHV